MMVFALLPPAERLGWARPGRFCLLCPLSLQLAAPREPAAPMARPGLGGPSRQPSGAHGERSQALSSSFPFMTDFDTSTEQGFILFCQLCIWEPGAPRRSWPCVS